jgi:hypothetical protein
MQGAVFGQFSPSGAGVKARLDSATSSLPLAIVNEPSESRSAMGDPQRVSLLLHLLSSR